MCELLDQHQVQGVPACRRQPYKLSELPGAYHCALIGTCLSMLELKKLVKRFNLGAEPMSDYDRHHALVQVIGRDLYLSKYLNKQLNKKFTMVLKRYRKMTSEEQLVAAWCEDLAQGNYIGPFWATMSHPLAQPSLWYAVHGDIHMLSHQVAQEKFTDIHRTQQLESENTAIQVAHDRLQKRLEKQAACHEPLLETHQQLKVELLALKQENQRLSQRQAATATRKAETSIQVLQDRFQQLQQQYQQQQQTLVEQQQAHQTLEEQNHQLQQECRALEYQLNKALLCESACGLLNDGQGYHQGGYKVLYVGGRASNCAKMRSIVEQENGKFHYHDGGLEENTANLDGLLSRADFIMCPIDCVSHDACLKVKKYCKRNAKPFIPLRSSGLSSFSVGLEEGRSRLI